MLQNTMTHLQIAQAQVFLFKAVFLSILKPVFQDTPLFFPVFQSSR